MDAQVKGIKETLEVVSLVEALAEAVAKVMEDGKVTVIDIGALLPLIGPARAAVEGMALIKEEMKDLSKEETAEIAAAMFEVVNKLLGAFQPKPE